MCRPPRDSEGSQNNPLATDKTLEILEEFIDLLEKEETESQIEHQGAKKYPRQ